MAVFKKKKWVGIGPGKNAHPPPRGSEGESLLRASHINLADSTPAGGGAVLAWAVLAWELRGLAKAPLISCGVQPGSGREAQQLEALPGAAPGQVRRVQHRRWEAAHAVAAARQLAGVSSFPRRIHTIHTVRTIHTIDIPICKVQISMGGGASAVGVPGHMTV